MIILEKCLLIHGQERIGWDIKREAGICAVIGCTKKVKSKFDVKRGLLKSNIYCKHCTQELYKKWNEKKKYQILKL